MASTRRKRDNGKRNKDLVRMLEQLAEGFRPFLVKIQLYRCIYVAAVTYWWLQIKGPCLYANRWFLITLRSTSTANGDHDTRS